MIDVVLPIPIFKANNHSQMSNITSNLILSPVISYHDYIVAKSTVVGLGLTRTMEW